MTRLANAGHELAGSLSGLSLCPAPIHLPRPAPTVASGPVSRAASLAMTRFLCVKTLADSRDEDEAGGRRHRQPFSCPGLTRGTACGPCASLAGEGRGRLGQHAVSVGRRVGRSFAPAGSIRSADRTRATVAAAVGRATPPCGAGAGPRRGAKPPVWMVVVHRPLVTGDDAAADALTGQRRDGDRP